MAAINLMMPRECLSLHEPTIIAHAGQVAELFTLKPVNDSIYPWRAGAVWRNRPGGGMVSSLIER